MYQVRTKPAQESALSINDAILARIETDTVALLEGPMARRNFTASTKMAVMSHLERIVLREMAIAAKRSGGKA